MKRAQLDQIPAPPATRSWSPLGHSTVRDIASEVIRDRGFGVTETKIVVVRDDHRHFTTPRCSVNSALRSDLMEPARKKRTRYRLYGFHGTLQAAAGGLDLFQAAQELEIPRGFAADVGM